MEKTVEAVICGHEITSAEVDAFIASLPREQQVYASHPDFRKQCVDQLIAVYALGKCKKRYPCTDGDRQDF